MKPTSPDQGVFAEALLRDTPEARAAYLNAACGTDTALRQRVEALLRAAENAGDFLEEPPTGLSGDAVATQLVSELINGKPGHCFGDYELLEEIARGGMGIVFKARQRKLDRIVAVKMILAGGFASREQALRFRVEAEAAARLQHPNIVRIHETGEQDGQPYFSMDYVEGGNLAALVREKPLPAKRAAGWVKTIAEAIHYAHEQGILHRDLKPSNVLINHAGHPHLTDFGLAKRMTKESFLTVTGDMMGSPSFMPPEQAGAKGVKAGRYSDVYGLGAILFYLVTGRPPFVAENVAETLHHVLNTEPVSPRLLNPSAPQDIATICLKCLEKEPGKRFQTAQQLADELGRFLNDEPIHARPVSAAEKVWRWCRRQPAIASLSGATLALLLAVAIGSPVAAYRINSARKHAQEALTQMEIKRAEDLFTADDSAGALALLAQVLRRNPDHRAVTERLLSALTQRGFALPLIGPIKHDEWVTSAEFSSSGRLLVTASNDHTARIWDALTGQPITPPLQHDSGVSLARFSRDSNWVLTLTERAVAVWDAHSGQLVTGPIKHPDSITTAGFSPDSKFFVTASRDGVARLWEVSSGKLVSDAFKQREFMTSARFSPDGQRLVTASWDKTARVWDLRTGLPVTGRLQHDGDVLSAEFSPNGERVLTASEDGTARLWDSRTGEAIGERLLHGGPVNCAEFSLDGIRIATGAGDNSARIWDARTGRPISGRLKHKAGVLNARFSLDGQRLLTVCGDSSIRVWDGQTGEPLTQAIKPNLWAITAQLSPDGDRLVTASMDHTVWVWDIRPGAALGQVFQHASPVLFAQFSPDQRRVATADRDRFVHLWDTRTASQVVEPFRFRRPVTFADFSLDGERLATASGDKTARIWDTQTGRPISEPFRHGSEVTLARFSPDGGRLLTVAGDYKLRVWDTRSGELLVGPMLNESPIIHACFTADGERVATLSREGAHRIWNARSGEPLTGRDERIVPLSFVSGDLSRDEGRVVAALDHTARIWDTQTAQELSERLQHDQKVRSVRFSPDEKRVATASDDHTARVWDASSGLPLTERLEHGAAILSVRFSADGHWIVTASMDHSAKVWEVPIVSTPAPSWLPELAEAIAGQRSDDQHRQKISCERLLALRQQLTGDSGLDEYSRWAKWFFANRDLRSISPASVVTVSEYVQHAIGENTLKSLREAMRLAPNNALTLARLAKQVMREKSRPSSEHLEEADFLIKRALSLAPKDREVLQIREEIAESLRQLPLP